MRIRTSFAITLPAPGAAFTFNSPGPNGSLTTYPHIISIVQTVLTTYGIESSIMCMTGREPTKRGRRRNPGKQTGEVPTDGRHDAVDRLAEAQRAANSILAGWALHELVASRTSR